MIKCEVVESFTLKDYGKLKNVKKVIERKANEFGKNDTFECDKEMADYLLGNNVLNKVVVKVIEVMPEEKPIKIDLEDPYKDYEEPKTTKKKKTSKK